MSESATTNQVKPLASQASYEGGGHANRDELFKLRTWLLYHWLLFHAVLPVLRATSCTAS